MGRTYAWLLFLGLLQNTACSASRCHWQRDSTLTHTTGAPIPKRLAIVGWPQTGAILQSDFAKTEVGLVLAHVGADFVKMRRNFLVYRTDTISRHWAEACQKPVEGVLLIRALSARTQTSDRLALEVAAELYECAQGALLWRLEGQTTTTTHDAHLSHLTQNYAETLGKNQAGWIAPSFSLLQDLLEQLPNVVLSDTEIDERIELESAMLAPTISTALASRGL